MKHGSNSRRGRSRGNGKRHSSPRNQTFDSNGPEGKVRGTPQQILDKYLSLARDAASAGEHIAAEGFYQFAEHYYRILNADQQHRQRMAEAQQQSADANDDSSDDQDGDSAADRETASQDGGNGKPRRERGNGRRRNDGERKTADASKESESGGDTDSGTDDAAASESAQGEESERTGTESASPA